MKLESRPEDRNKPTTRMIRFAECSAVCRIPRSSAKKDDDPPRGRPVPSVWPANSSDPSPPRHTIRPNPSTSPGRHLPRKRLPKYEGAVASGPGEALEQGLAPVNVNAAVNVSFEDILSANGANQASAGFFAQPASPASPACLTLSALPSHVACTRMNE